MGEGGVRERGERWEREGRGGRSKAKQGKAEQGRARQQLCSNITGDKEFEKAAVMAQGRVEASSRLVCKEENGAPRHCANVETFPDSTARMKGVGGSLI